MNVKLKNGKPASEERILALEGALGLRLSESFKNFIREHNGAEPENNVFRISDNNECGVDQFIPVQEIVNERTRIENLPLKAYPVAWAEGGNYVFIDEGQNGAVFFWDHEQPIPPVKLTSNFGEFLALLQPFDIKTVRLEPGQVKRIWVNPEFLKRQKQKS